MTPVIRDFKTLVEYYERGALSARLNDNLLDLIEALDANFDEKCNGSLTLTLKVQRIGDRKEVLATVKMALPPDKPLPSANFFGVEGGLSLEHPSQNDMFSTPREVRTSSTK